MSYEFKIFLFFFSILTCFAFTGDDRPMFKLNLKISLGGSDFSTDNLGNIYIYKRNNLKKLNPAGELQYSYSSQSYGDITYIDVTDPLKVLVFYRNFPEIVILDNTLSQNGDPISPNNLGYPLASLTCTSHDNGLWLYDGQNYDLVRLDATLKINVESGNISQLVGYQVNPTMLAEYNNYVYLDDTVRGLLVFDIYGTYFKTIPLLRLTHFELRGDNLYYIQNRKLHIFHTKTLDEENATLPDGAADEARVEKNVLYEKCTDTLRVFKIL